MERETCNIICSLIAEYDTIVIHRHLTPDGDAMGSQLGLRYIIEENWKNKKVWMVGDAFDRLSFMYDGRMDDIDDSVYSGALAIVLDSSSDYLISDTRYTKAAKTLRIDHHLFIRKICDEEVVLTDYESCAGIIADWALSAGLRLTTDAARALYTGMVTDSVRFMTEKVSPLTMKTAAELISYPFDRTELFASLYAEDFSALRRKAYFLERVEFLEEDGVAYNYSDKKDIEKMHSNAHSVARGLVNTMANIKGADAWVAFAEDEGKILVELRSRRCDVYPVALKWGGGGHAKASGCTVESRKEAFELLDDVKKEVRKER
jgi:bifunctional oligoribonuclease and PAP phosphatase NrnA